MISRICFLMLAGLILASCDSGNSEKIVLVVGNSPVKNVQAISLFGDSLRVPERSEESEKRLTANLIEAKKKWTREPNEENYIWYGRRTAYLTDYDNALQIFSDGIIKYPESYRLYRHRGHRFVSTRKFNLAIGDFEKAATLIGDIDIEIEPDGAPNAQNIPLSNTQFNIYYHLGLAHYLKGDWEKAATAYKKCLEYSINDDLQTATLDWLYMTLRKLSKEEEAADLLQFVSEDMEIIENSSYFKRLMMYKGEIPPDSLLNTTGSEVDDITLVTQGYGVGNYLIDEGRVEEGVSILQRVLKNRNWSGFGYIAAEADLKRMGVAIQ